MKEFKTEHTFDFDDFEDPEGLERRLGISWNLFENQLICDISCYPIPYVPATRFDPPEGGYLEDLSVSFGKFDITDELTELALDLLGEKVMEEVDDANNRD